MYIEGDDYKYFFNLYETLDEEKKMRFIDILKDSASEKKEERVDKIKLITKELIALEKIEQKDLVTKTMIKKAYKTAKEEQK